MSGYSMGATSICKGCSFDVDFVDAAGLCHDCAWAIADDPDLTVGDLPSVMPGPADIAAMFDESRPSGQTGGVT